MSMKQKDETAITETPSPAPAPRSPKFTVERLRRDCFGLFGITASTYDGATHGLTGEFSVAEMRAVIQKWQEQGVYAPKKNEREVW